MKLRPALVVALSLTACFNFDADLEKCREIGKCVDDGVGGGAAAGGGTAQGGGDGGGGSATFNLVGASAATVAFGDVARADAVTSAPLSVFVDAGVADFSFFLDNAAINAGFSVTPTCPSPAASCPFTVAFTSSAAPGAVVGALFIDAGVAGTAVLPLSANLVQRFSLEPSTPRPIDFGAVNLGQQAPSRSVRLLHAARTPTSMMFSAPPSFSASTQCAALDGSSCDFDITFTPTDAGRVTGVMTVTDPLGYAESIDLTGEAFPPSDVRFTPSPLAFGVVDAGTAVTLPFSARNVGALPVAFSISAAGAAFSIDAGTCASGMLASDAGCSGTVRFLPAAPGVASGTMTFSGLTTAVLPLSGTGRASWLLTVRPDGGIISSANPSFSCPSACTQSFEETVAAPQVTLTAAPASVFYGMGTWSGSCSGPAATPCGVTMNTNHLIGADFPRVAEPVTLSVTPADAGTITGVTGASCGPGCFAVPSGTTVTLTATARRGFLFTGWSGGAAGCGTQPQCMLTVPNGGVAVSASFAAFNYAFVTSRQFSANEVARADVHCANTARDAGLPGNFLAFVMTADGGTFNRFAGSRGWMRTDDRPFLDTLDGGLSRTSPVVYYPLSLDERGTPLGPLQQTWVGLDTNGALANCGAWTDTNFATTAPGWVWSTSQGWYARANEDCSGQRHLYCLATGASLQLRPAPVPANAIVVFVTSTTTGAGNDGGQCAIDAAAAGLLLDGGRTAHVFRATSTASATAVSGISAPPSRPIYRPDGVLLYASNAQDGGYGVPPPAGLNALANGALLPWSTTSAVWFGRNNLLTPGLATCSDWGSSTVVPGSPPALESDLGGAFELAGFSCAGPQRTLCVAR